MEQRMTDSLDKCGSGSPGWSCSSAVKWVCCHYESKQYINMSLSHVEYSMQYFIHSKHIYLSPAGEAKSGMPIVTHCWCTVTAWSWEVCLTDVVQPSDQLIGFVMTWNVHHSQHIACCECLVDLYWETTGTDGLFGEILYSTSFLWQHYRGLSGQPPKPDCCVSHCLTVWRHLPTPARDVHEDHVCPTGMEANVVRFLWRWKQTACNSHGNRPKLYGIPART